MKSTLKGHSIVLFCSFFSWYIGDKTFVHLKENIINWLETLRHSPSVLLKSAVEATILALRKCVPTIM